MWFKMFVCILSLSCQVKRLYLLVGPDDEDPFQRMLTSALFSKLTKINSRFAQLIQTVSGDLSAPGLALSAADRATLCSSVQLIIHAGADIRFDAPLRDATLTNVRGTREMLRLAADAPGLQGFAHVSTVLAHCVQPSTVEERFYGAPMVPQQLLDYVEAAETGTGGSGWSAAELQLLTGQLILPYPNTYTFTMAVAERLVQDAAATLPAVVVRPSIVLSTLDDPTPGFTKSAHAVNDLLIAVTTGSMRVLAAHPDRQAPVCFSDYVVNVTLAAMHARHSNGAAAVHATADTDANVVYNASVNHADLRWGSLFGGIVKNAHDNPTLRSVWTPRVHLMRCAVQVWLFVMLYEVLPGLMADGLLRLVGCPARVMPGVRRNAAARQEYAFFMRGHDEREIVCDRVAELQQGMDKSDRAFFALDLSAASFDWNDYGYKLALGLKRYILGENLNNREEAQRRQRKYRLAHGGVLVAYYATMVALVAVVFRGCGMCGVLRHLWEA